MPNVGWGEMLLVVFIALLVFGPRKLPDMMKSLGSALRAFQEESSKATETLRQAVEAPQSDVGVVDRPDDATAPVLPPATNGPVVSPEYHEDT